MFDKLETVQELFDVFDKCHKAHQTLIRELNAEFEATEDEGDRGDLLVELNEHIDLWADIMIAAKTRLDEIDPHATVRIQI